MNYSITIDQFEGPLDLLLHLIKESKLSILDIKIDKITTQYLSYIKTMENLNLTIASEYLVMASELIEMKSKLLLPKKEEEKEEEIDERQDLIDRLLAYQQYKELSKKLRQKELTRKELYTKQPENMKKYMKEKTFAYGTLSADDLLKALSSFLEHQKENQPLNTKITSKELTVEQRRYEIKNILKKQKRVSFFSLFSIPTKEYIVVTFLAVLEMAKNFEILITQENNFEEIICEVIS